jgi:hypothetical protein
MSPAEITALAQLLAQFTPVAVDLVKRITTPQQATVAFADMVKEIDFDFEYVKKVEEANAKLTEAIQHRGGA